MEFIQVLISQMFHTIQFNFSSVKKVQRDLVLDEAICLRIQFHFNFVHISYLFRVIF